MQTPIVLLLFCVNAQVQKLFAIFVSLYNNVKNPLRTSSIKQEEAASCQIRAEFVAAFRVEEPKDEVEVIQRKKNLSLLIAAYVGHKECVDIFIKEGADVNCSDQQFDKDCRKKIALEVGNSETTGDPFILVDGGTPLMYASALGHVENVKLLVKEGADMNLVRGKRMALGMAAQGGYHECLDYLIKAGVTVNVADPSVKPALMYAVHSSESSNITDDKEKCVQLLIKAGAGVNIFHSGDWLERTTPLVEAVQFGNKGIISMLLAAGADVNLESGVEFPLHTALSHRRFPYINLLVQAGADVNQQNSLQMTPLHTAVNQWHETRTMHLLLKSGADVNIPDDAGTTPLMRAANDCENILVMIRQGRYEYQNSEERRFHRVRCLLPVRVLSEAGVQINRKDCNGDNALKNTLKWACLSSPSVEADNYQMNLYMLLFAAGETLDGPTTPKLQQYYTVRHFVIPEYFKELKENLALKHLCREAIRKHLIDLDRHENLFRRIPQLRLPSILEKYLLYNCDVNVDMETDSDNDFQHDHYKKD